MSPTYYRLTFFILFFGLSQSILSQNEFHISSRTKEIVLEKGTYYYLLDTFSVVPSSVDLLNSTDTLQNSYRFCENGIVFSDTLLIDNLSEQKITFAYRRFPLDFEKKYYHLDPKLALSKDKAIYIGYDYTSSTNESQLWNKSGIDYDGSFARGFSLGNSQSLLLNSNFNMQMSGDIGEGIKIKAAISDDNIPIQPEGNTRLLQEFDKVFIQVSKDESYITAGDYELNRPQSYFINYFKQVQGLSAYNKTTFDTDHSLSNKASFAVSRAKFNRLLLPVIEANQGPYKLPGANGERFIIIEAGSERIYEDGKLLTRGQNHDYLINYDRAEITFTEKRLITKDSRITAEYEYVDLNYLRTMYAAESQYDFKKWSLKFNFYSQQDSKNVTGDRQLDSTDLDILMSSGDDLENSRRWGGRLVDETIDESVITYTLSVDSILTYSVNPDSILYIAVFSEVEQGLGDYIIDPDINANGRVYTYAGAGMGNYIPEIQLVAPQKNQIISLGAAYKLSDKTMIESEFALSNNDLNRFSNIDSEDDQGIASYLKINHQMAIGKEKQVHLTPFLAMEYTQENFQALNPYRAVEFTRDWNLAQNIEKTNELILKTGFSLKRNKDVDLSYSLSSLTRKNIYDAQLHNLDYRLKFKKLEFTSQSSLLLAEDLDEKSTFLRPILGVSRKIGSDKPWELGYVYEAETNERTNIITNQITESSAAFRVHKYFVKSPERDKLKGQISFEDRVDKAINGDAFTSFSKASDLIVAGSWNPHKSSALNLDFTYRDLMIIDPTLASAKNVQARKSYLGQIDYRFDLFNGFLKSTSSFNIGSGQQAKVEYDYQEVLPGEGSYDWIDVNEDGIQQLAEFRLSEFQDTSRYIQVPLYNNEFIQTNNSGINQSLRLDAKKLFQSTNKNNNDPNKKVVSEKKISLWKKSIQRLSLLSTIRINKKVEVDETSYSPFDFGFSDTTIVNYNSFNNHTLFINRGNPKWDVQVGFRDTKSKFVQISGFESRLLEEYFTRYRMGIDARLDFILNLKNGVKSGDSEILDARDFEINYYSIKPEINYRPLGNLRFILKYDFQNKSQNLQSMETMKSNDFSLEATWRKTRKISWTSGLSFIKVDFEGETQSFTAFELLEGLKPGNNYLWNTSFTKRLAENVDFILNYEGRKTGDNMPIHTARAQVKATF